VQASKTLLNPLMMKKEFNPANAGDEEIEQKLWEFIDGVVPEAERDTIEQLVAAQATWRTKYNELLEIHHAINAAEIEQPSMRFTRNVMEEIARQHIAPAARRYINKKIVWGIAAFFLLAIVGFLAYAFSQTEASGSSNDTALGGIDFTAVDYSRVFSNNFVNAFVMLNIVLALMLLDRYLAQRKSNWQRA